MFSGEGWLGRAELKGSGRRVWGKLTGQSRGTQRRRREGDAGEGRGGGGQGSGGEEMIGRPLLRACESHHDD